MLNVDTRAGSQELIEPLKKRGLPVVAARLEYGDLSWVGNGPDGPCGVGVEFKTLGDLVNCIASKRFTGHQLPGLKDTFSFIFLMVEGIWRPGEDGRLEVPQGGGWRPFSHGPRGWTYSQVHKWLLSILLQSGIFLLKTATRQESLQCIHDLYTWWTAEEWGEHGAVQERAVLPLHYEGLRPPTPMQRMFAALPGIGWEKAQAIEQRFGRVRKAVMATEQEWLQVEGVGRKTAGKVMEVLA